MFPPMLVFSPACYSDSVVGVAPLDINKAENVIFYNVYIVFIKVFTIFNHYLFELV